MQIKSLILKISFLASLLVICYFGFVYTITQGHVDRNYYKFTHKAGSLILGISRAHDAISPAIIEQELNNFIQKPMLNFAFEKSQSSYGAIYLNAIKHKIDTTSNNGLFVLSVSPGNFLITKGLKDSANIELDKNTILGKMTNFNSHPNYEYVRKCYDGSLYRGLLKPQEMLINIHPDGWLEFKSRKLSKEKQDAIKEHWMKLTNNGYRQVAKYQKKSEYRMQMLEETINYLNNYGTVIITRLPIDSSFLALEDNFWPDFNKRINVISNRQQVPYFDFSTTGNLYDSYDGSHLYGESAKRFTKTLCDSIKIHQAKNLQ